MPEKLNYFTTQQLQDIALRGKLAHAVLYPRANEYADWEDEKGERPTEGTHEAIHRLLADPMPVPFGYAMELLRALGYEPQWVVFPRKL